MTTDILLFFVGSVIVFLIGYYIIHSSLRLTNLGRIVSGLTVAIGALLDQAQALPWGSILDAARAEAVAFGIAAGMGIVHAFKVITDALNPPAPPPAG